jgi:LCP family protein required for cell wall assembly
VGQADPPSTSGPSLRSSRTLAAVLSFVVPGTGQLLTGRLTVAILFLLPFVLAVPLGLVAAGGDPASMLGYLAQPDVLLAIVVIDALILVWRSAAIVDAWSGAGSRAPRTAVSAVVLVALLGVTVATHYAVGAQVLAVRDTVQTVFASTDDGGDDGFGEIPDPTPVPTTTPQATPDPHSSTTASMTPGPTPTPSSTPAPTPRPGPLTDGRVDVLLVGGDAGPGRWGLRTDTLMLLSVDVRSGEAALFSIPRNLMNVPLPKESRRAFACRCYPRLINSLYTYASGHPRQFPGKDSVRGLRALQMAIGTLVGRRLDGMVVVKLQGFVRLVNAIGGVTVTVPRAVYDARYPLENGKGYVSVYIRAGKQRMTGRKALMYARSRHQDSDYSRMVRQQLVLQAIGRKLLREPIIDRLPELLDIAKENLWTNLKTRDLPQLAALADQVDVKGMKKIRFNPPKYPTYLDRAAIRRIRSVVDHVFDRAKPLPTPTPTPVPTLPLGRGS